MNREKDDRKIEIIFFIVFLAAISVVAYFHEPWLDEAQAWMIAREASLWEIFFEIPHTEGHPPLWHLLLLPFARLGAPYELTIKSVAVLISAASAGMVLFCSPFPRGLRRILPFTYFFFYQYGVIARPYGLMLLAFLLAACTYREKTEKPWRHVLSLALLCLSSAYGIVFAGGICIVWLLELWRGKTLADFVREMLRSRCFFALLFLLVLAVCLMVEIMPGEDTYTGALYSKNGMVFKLLFLFVVLPVEALFGQCLFSYASIGNVQYNTVSFVIELILGVLLWCLLLYYGKKRGTLLLLVIPVCLFDAFSAVVYMHIHHIGLLFLYLVFWYWVCCQKNSMARTGGALEPANGSAAQQENEAVEEKPAVWKGISEKDRRLLLKMGGLLPYLFCLVSVWWNLSASFLEIQENYGYGRGVVAFLEENGMLDLNILTEWKSGRAKDGKTYYEDSNCRYITVAMSPYLTDSQIGKLLQCAQKPYYNTNIPADEEENRRNYDLWASRGEPDVIIGSCEVEEVYGGRVSMADYTPVAEVPTNFIWKNLITRQYLFLYLKTDLLQEYQMTPLTEQEGNHYINNRVPAPAERE